MMQPTTVLDAKIYYEVDLKCKNYCPSRESKEDLLKLATSIKGTYFQQKLNIYVNFAF